jgi:hypothetical protein
VAVKQDEGISNGVGLVIEYKNIRRRRRKKIDANKLQHIVA